MDKSQSFVFRQEVPALARDVIIVHGYYLQTSRISLQIKAYIAHGLEFQEERTRTMQPRSDRDINGVLNNLVYSGNGPVRFGYRACIAKIGGFAPD
ncbi:unnamed protein product, partial [Iphiclides podalirius]